MTVPTTFQTEQIRQSVLATLRSRGCIHDVSHEDELEKLLQSKSVRFYCGFDPTADSLHVGSMLPLLLMRRLQRAGHQPIVLLGSATGMIGDPSGKSEERKLLDEEVLRRNTNGIEQQIALFLEKEGRNGYTIVRNDSWLGSLHLIPFLRDIGKLFSVNVMLGKESVRARLENREQGISYTEFSYALLQAYDFYHLYSEQECQLQVGGSDQWGNITAGLDLIRRKVPTTAAPAFGMTFPLLTTSSGTKFGKTERGTVWLDAKKTSPYQFYQYWLQTEDADVIRFIQLFTELEGDELAALCEQAREQPEERSAQERLATLLTTLIHGADECRKAKEASRVLFGGSVESLDATTLREIFNDVPSVSLDAGLFSEGLTLGDLIVSAQIAPSKSAARRLIEGGGVYLNNQRCADPNSKVSLQNCIDGKLLLIRSGKKNYTMVQLV